LGRAVTGPLLGRGLFVDRPGGGSSLRRIGAAGEVLLSEAGLRAAWRRAGLAQNLGELRQLRAADDALRQVAEHLEQMRALAAHRDGERLQGAEREAIERGLIELKAAIDALAAKHLGGTRFVPSSVMPAAEEVANAPSTAATDALLASSGIRVVGGGGDSVVSTVAVAAGSGLALGAQFDTNEVTALNVSQAAAGVTFALAAEGTAYTVQDLVTSTMVVGAVFADQTVTDVDVSAAVADRTLDLQRTGLGRVRMRDATSGASQTLDLALVVGGGEKVLNFDQLGVRITLSGGAVLADTLAQALDGQTVVTKTQTDYDRLRLTNTLSGANQVVTFDAIALTSGPKLVDFFALGVAFTLDGPAESTLDALVLSMDGVTLTTETEETVVPGGAVFVDAPEEDAAPVTISSVVVAGPQTEAADDLEALTAAVADALAEVSQRRAAVRSEVERLRSGEPLDGPTAARLTEGLMFRASLFPAAHGGIDRELVAMLLAAEGR
jgi:hypothetical protein